MDLRLLTENILIFRFKNTPVYFSGATIAFLVFIFGWGMFIEDKYFYFIMSFITLSFLHELGHFYFIRRAEAKAHKISIHLFGGSVEYEHVDDPWESFLISSGGIMVQLLLIPIAYCFYYLYGPFENQAVQSVYFVFTIHNSIFVCINLLPIQGLDGYNIWRYLQQSLKTFNASRNFQSPRLNKAKTRKVLSFEKIKKEL